MKQQRRTGHVKHHGMLCDCKACVINRTFHSNRVEAVQLDDSLRNELLHGLRTGRSPDYSVGEDWNDD